MSIRAVKEVEHGWHRDYYYPGMIRSAWEAGPFCFVRIREYKDPANTKLKTEAFTLSVRTKSQRAGFKWERDCN